MPKPDVRHHLSVIGDGTAGQRIEQVEELSAGSDATHRQIAHN